MGAVWSSSSHAPSPLPIVLYTLDHWELKNGDNCELGSQLRPHIVWFGESVTMIETAMSIASEADIFIVIGTSMVIYPAASLINYVSNEKIEQNHRP